MDVAVLNVDLLPNSIDTVVIGDRLFSLRIQVEGFEVNEVHANQMEVDEGNSGAGHNMEGRDDGPSDSNASQGNGNKKNACSSPQHNNTSSADKQTDNLLDGANYLEAMHGTVHEHYETSKTTKSGNSLNLNQTSNVANTSAPIIGDHQQIFCADREGQQTPTMVTSQNYESNIGKEVRIEEGGVDVDLQGTGDEYGTTLRAKITKTEHQKGNSTLNLNRTHKEASYAMHMPNYIVHKPSSHAELGSQLTITFGSPHMAESGVNKGNEGDLGVLVTPAAAKILKRSKRREDSVDEDSSTRAERLKAKQNLDGPGTLKSKSFLALSDSKVVNNTTTLGVSLGKDVRKSIACLKEVEHNRLLQASNSEPKHIDTCQLYDEEVSDMDSDLGLDQHAIQHLVGDIAEDILGMEGTPWSDFKPVPRKPKSGSTKERKSKKKVNIQLKNSQ
jgi:hypothetical protein